MKYFFLLGALFLALMVNPCQAQQLKVVGGQTSVLLDTATLSSVGLDLSSVSSNVIVPGNLGGDSVAFEINSRSATPPTTFTYELFDLAPFSGSIEHMGSVFFNSDTVEVGDFSIGFDGGRAIGVNSGFFVESTAGVTAILFDIENPSDLNAGDNSLLIEANLLVSEEFAAFLGDANLAGADVGDALVEANAIPEPAALSLLGVFGLTLMARRRR